MTSSDYQDHNHPSYNNYNPQFNFASPFSAEEEESIKNNVNNSPLFTFLEEKPMQNTHSEATLTTVASSSVMSTSCNAGDESPTAHLNWDEVGRGNVDLQDYVGGYHQQSSSSISSSKLEKTCSDSTTGSNGSSNKSPKKGTTAKPARRQKRLERNRESARLSRRRRKQYLEELEEKVTVMCYEMDENRRKHVAASLQCIQTKRLNGSCTNTALERTSNELKIVHLFNSQQLQSLSLPPSTKFINWLTLQNETFFRGGRAASERLSAARIGERMLATGHDKVSPCQAMWPLLCNEVGLSYDQEERLRCLQRTILAQNETWMHRHSAQALQGVLNASRDVGQALMLRLGQRERSGIHAVLGHGNTANGKQQQATFHQWTMQNQHRLQSLKQTLINKHQTATVNKSAQMSAEGKNEYKLNSNYHVAANLYILRHKLRDILVKDVAPAPLPLTGLAMKKLSRRPAFESIGGLACGEESQSGCGNGISRQGSFASSGSLKRTASEMSMDHYSDKHQQHSAAVDAVEAQVMAQEYVSTCLKPVEALVPTQTTSSFSFADGRTTPISSRVASSSEGHQWSSPALSPQYNNQLIPSYSAPIFPTVQLSPVRPNPVVSGTQAAASASLQEAYQSAVNANNIDDRQGVESPVFPEPALVDPSSIYAIGPPPAKHSRQSSFLPAHLNVVPEEMWPANEDADDFLLSLVDGDWAIGEGVDMEY